VRAYIVYAANEHIVTKRGDNFTQQTSKRLKFTPNEDPVTRIYVHNELFFSILSTSNKQIQFFDKVLFHDDEVTFFCPFRFQIYGAGSESQDVVMSEEDPCSGPLMRGLLVEGLADRVKAEGPS
jgi:hypothetical protein